MIGSDSSSNSDTDDLPDINAGRPTTQPPPLVERRWELNAAILSAELASFMHEPLSEMLAVIAEYGQNPLLKDFEVHDIVESAEDPIVAWDKLYDKKRLTKDVKKSLFSVVNPALFAEYQSLDGCPDFQKVMTEPPKISLGELAIWAVHHTFTRQGESKCWDDAANLLSRILQLHRYTVKCKSDPTGTPGRLPALRGKQIETIYATCSEALTNYAMKLEPSKNSGVGGDDEYSSMLREKGNIVYETLRRVQDITEWQSTAGDDENGKKTAKETTKATAASQNAQIRSKLQLMNKMVKRRKNDRVTSNDDDDEYASDAVPKNNRRPKRRKVDSFLSVVEKFLERDQSATIDQARQEKDAMKKKLERGLGTMKQMMKDNQDQSRQEKDAMKEELERGLGTMMQMMKDNQRMIEDNKRMMEDNKRMMEMAFKTMHRKQ